MGASGLIDKLSYNYSTTQRIDYIKPKPDQQGNPTQFVTVPTSNKLNSVTDASGNAEGMPATTENYDYDKDGNLKEDPQNRYVWNAFGKLKTVTTKAGNHKIMDYLYDASGQRVLKWKKATGSGPVVLEWYVKDATGNEMAQISKSDQATNPSLKSFQIYGNSRIGSHTGDESYTIGQRQYELTDHLGNVRASITDERKKVAGNTFEPTILTGSEYYPYGMPSRTYVLSGQTYRFGFNGQQKEDDINGPGNHNTALFWEYDTRTGRRWNLDPVVKPFQSGYFTFRGNPLVFVDPNGDDDFFHANGTYSHSDGKKTNTIFICVNGENVKFSTLTSMKDNASINTAANVVGHYRTAAGLKPNQTVGVSPNASKEDKGASYTNQSGIWVATKTGASELLDDAKNLVNTLAHERYHQSAGDPKDEQFSYSKHAARYEAQFKDPTFAETTNEYKAGMANNYAGYLLGAAKKGQINQDQVLEKIITFNSTYKEYGLKINAQPSASGVPSLTTKGLTNEGKSTGNQAVVAPKNGSAEKVGD